MAEKSLKSLFAFHQQLPPKIHDLQRLATELEHFIPDIGEIDESLTILSKYYSATRYPGDFPEGFSWENASEAFSVAMKIKDFVFKKIGM